MKNPEHDEYLLQEKEENIDFLVDVIREIYAKYGEDEEIAILCNKVLTDSRIFVEGGGK